MAVAGLEGELPSCEASHDVDAGEVRELRVGIEPGHDGVRAGEAGGAGDVVALDLVEVPAQDNLSVLGGERRGIGEPAQARRSRAGATPNRWLLQGARRESRPWSMVCLRIAAVQRAQPKEGHGASRHRLVSGDLLPATRRPPFRREGLSGDHGGLGGGRRRPGAPAGEPLPPLPEQKGAVGCRP